jgi:hypothetical protein
MSLNLGPKNGIAYSLNAITNINDISSALFNSIVLNTSNIYIIKVDTSAGDVDLTNMNLPNTLNFLEDGDLITFIKSTNDINKIIIDDLSSGTSFNGFTENLYDYINRKGESITILVDTINNKYGVKI